MKVSSASSLQNLSIVSILENIENSVDNMLVNSKLLPGFELFEFEIRINGLSKILPPSVCKKINKHTKPFITKYELFTDDGKDCLRKNYTLTYNENGSLKYTELEMHVKKLIRSTRGKNLSDALTQSTSISFHLPDNSVVIVKDNIRNRDDLLRFLSTPNVLCSVKDASVSLERQANNILNFTKVVTIKYSILQDRINSIDLEDTRAALCAIQLKPLKESMQQIATNTDNIEGDRKFASRERARASSGKCLPRGSCNIL